MSADSAQKARRPSPRRPDLISVYKSVGGVELKAHIFTPAGFAAGQARPAFLFFHPGGWQMGEPAWGYDICHRYASLGMVSISFQYRLSSSGGATPVEAVLDARSAIRWTRQHSAELGIDSGRLVVFAISAGAHLAACTAMLSGPDEPTDDRAFSSLPDVLILQSAPLDTSIEGHFQELLQGRYKAEDYSPLHHVKPGLPPMYLIHGTADVIVPYRSASDFAARMQKAGNHCSLHTFEGTDHFFSKKSDQDRATALTDGILHDLGYTRGDQPSTR